MNVLFVGGGRRVVLARMFIKRGWRVYAYETSQNIPIASVVEVAIGKRWDDPSIQEDLLAVTGRMGIDLVLPLMDAAIQVCAGINGGEICHVLATDTNAVCADKKRLGRAILEVAPEIYPVPVVGQPIILKPRYGFGSKGLIWGVLGLEGEEMRDYIAQRQLSGLEFTVDAYFDREGAMVDAVPRLRRIVADGEVKSSVTVEYPVLQHYTRVVGEGIGLVGPINAQFIIENGWPFMTEINARFGGGFPLSMSAGFDVIGLIERDWFGKPLDYKPNTWKRNLATERYFEEFIYHEDGSH